jgi:hypothetical protein
MRVVRFVVLVVAIVVATSPTASAGGTSMRTPDEFVEPGEVVEFVAYVGAENADEGPWNAYLDTGEAVVALGPVTIEATGLGGYLSYRVYLKFTVPATLEPGGYWVSVQNESEFTDQQRVFLGDLIGAVVEVGYIGIPQFFGWPLDEPLVELLPSDAVLIGPDWEITAGEVRSGIYLKCEWDCLLDPTILQREDVTVVDARPSWATTPAPSTTVASTFKSTIVATTTVPALEIPSEIAAEVSSAPAQVEGGWQDLWWILLTLVGAVYLASRCSRAPIAGDLRVQEDDVHEPTRV